MGAALEAEDDTGPARLSPPGLGRGRGAGHSGITFLGDLVLEIG